MATPNLTVSAADIPWWIERSLKRMKKLTTLQEVRKRVELLTPYEMNALLNPEEISAATEDQFGNVARFIETIRNMAILAPIVVTWLSLAAASDAYEQTIAIDKTLVTVPFLEMWQAGFPLVKTSAVGPWHFSLINHHSHWFTFGNFAFFDASILGSLLVLTIIGQLLALWAFGAGKAMYRWMNGELYLLCTKSALWALGPQQKRQEPEIMQMISVLEKISSASQRQADAITKVDEDVSSMHEAANKMRDGGQKIFEAVTPIRPIISEMSKQAEELIQHRRLTEHQWNAMLQILAQATQSDDPKIRQALNDYQNAMQNPTPPLRLKRRWWQRLIPFGIR